MERQDDIRAILESLRTDGSLDEGQERRLTAFFDRARLELPAELLRPDGAAEARREVERRLAASRGPVRRWYAWAAVPAAAVLMAVLGFMLYPRFFARETLSVTVSEMRGTVRLVRGSVDKPLAPGAVINAGDRIVTGADSQVEVTAGTLARVQISPSSDFVLQSHSSGRHPAMLTGRVTRGSVFVTVSRLEKGDLVAMGAQGSRALVRGTTFLVRAEDGGDRYDVIEGKIQVRREVPDDLPPAVRESLERAYEEQSVVVTQNQHCKVDDDPETIRALRAGRPVEPQRLIPPRVEEGSSLDSSLQRSTVEFLERSARVEAPVSGETMVMVIPNDATVHVNGKRQETIGGCLFLRAGKHEVLIEAPGYVAHRETIVVGTAPERRAVILSPQSAEKDGRHRSSRKQDFDEEPVGNVPSL